MWLLGTTWYRIYNLHNNWPSPVVDITSPHWLPPFPSRACRRPCSPAHTTVWGLWLGPANEIWVEGKYVLLGFPANIASPDSCCPRDMYQTLWFKKLFMIYLPYLSIPSLTVSCLAVSAILSLPESTKLFLTIWSSFKWRSLPPSSPLWLPKSGLGVLSTYFCSAIHAHNHSTDHLFVGSPSFLSMFPHWVICLLRPETNASSCIHVFNIYWNSIYLVFITDPPPKKVPPILTHKSTFSPLFREITTSYLWILCFVLFPSHISSNSKSYWLYLPNDAPVHFTPFLLLLDERGGR